MEFQKIAELSSDQLYINESDRYYPILNIDRIGLQRTDGAQVNLDIAYYRKFTSQVRSAIVYLDDDTVSARSEALFPGLNQLRWQAWLDVANTLRHSVSETGLVITWWDNAQRIDLLTGRDTWVGAPVRDAFEPAYRDLWRQASGGFEKHNGSLSKLANWWLMDADKALESVRNTVTGKPGDLYFVVTIDDLARLSEMQALSGKSVPFETRIFNPVGNIHGQISKVKQWALAKGEGSYLVQHLPADRIRVWRITSAKGEKTLLARLLPFTSSLAVPVPQMKLLHRSEWSGYLSVYQLQSSGGESEN